MCLRVGMCNLSLYLSVCVCVCVFLCVQEVNEITAAGKTTAVLTLSVGSDAKAVKRVTEGIKSVSATISSWYSMLYL